MIDIEGMLVAGAAGDCIGSPVEGRAARPFSLPADPWRCTDDTDLTLATCRALAAGGEADPAVIAAELASAFRLGIRGLGASTLRALRALAEGAHWATAGRSGERAAGNGAAMRIAPLAVLMTGESSGDRQRIRDVCRITHKNDEAYVGALAVIRAIHCAAHGSGPRDLAGEIAEQLPDTRVRDALVVLAELEPGSSPADAASAIGCSGFVAESVPLAIYTAAWARGDAASAIRAAVECGGDTDTIASIAGQIAGAGGAAIPDAWRARLPVLDEIVELSSRLRRFATPAP